MPLRLYLLIMSIMTAFCWLVFGYIIWTIDPGVTSATGFWLFYLSLFLSLCGTTAIIGFVVRFIFLRHELIASAARLTGRQVKTAFRQSFLFSGFIVAILFLLSRGLLTALNLFLLIVGLSALELFLLSYGRTRSENREIDRNVTGQQDL